jgi:hypothetical protein
MTHFPILDEKSKYLDEEFTYFDYQSSFNPKIKKGLVLQHAKKPLLFQSSHRIAFLEHPNNTLSAWKTSLEC